MTDRATVLITRPAADAGTTARAVAERGFAPLIEPMLSIRWLAPVLPDLENVQAILFTSANGVRGIARLAEIPDVPAWTVGDATAEAARAAGFRRIASAGGDARSLADAVTRDLRPDGGTLLHAAGSDVAGDLAAVLAGAGFDVHRAILYEAMPAVTLSPAARRALETEAVHSALFFSPRTVRTFVRLVTQAGLARWCGAVEALCLSRACAEAAGSCDEGTDRMWRAVRVADHPFQDALLALLPEPRRPA